MRRVAALISISLATSIYLHSVPTADVNTWKQSLRAAQQAADDGEFDRARQLLIADVAKLEIANSNRFHLISTLNELGLVYSSLAQFSNAEHTYRRAIQLAEELPQAGGLVFAKLLGGLASVYLAVGRSQEADRLHVRALESLPPEFGPEHPERGQMLSNLGTVYSARHRYRQALQLYQQALTIFETAYGPDDERTCRVVQNLGVVAGQMGRHSQAAAYLARAISGLEARWGSSHPILLRPLLNQAQVHLRLRKSAAAEAFAVRALGIAELAYSPTHPLVAEAVLVYNDTLLANKRKP